MMKSRGLSEEGCYKVDFWSTLLDEDSQETHVNTIKSGKVNAQDSYMSAGGLSMALWSCGHGMQNSMCNTNVDGVRRWPPTQEL